MARNNQRGGTASRRAPKDLGRRVKKKPCALCRDKVEWVDYKDIPMLRKYMSDRGKIRSRRVTGNCAQHQRALAQAIKTSRELVLLPYTQRTVTERPGGRGGRDRGERTLGDTHGDGRPPRRSEGGGGSDRGDSRGSRDGSSGGSAGGAAASADGSTAGGTSGASADGAASGSDAAAGSANGDIETVGNEELDGDVLATLDDDVAAEAEEAGADA
jgi:small subunit ribosomal protein S18